MMHAALSLTVRPLLVVADERLLVVDSYKVNRSGSHLITSEAAIRESGTGGGEEPA